MPCSRPIKGLLYLYVGKANLITAPTILTEIRPTYMKSGLVYETLFHSIQKNAIT